MTKIRRSNDFRSGCRGGYSTTFVLMTETLAPSQVLCVIDFSESTERALKSAINLAMKGCDQVMILYPYRLTSFEKMEDIVSMKRDLDGEAMKRFQKLTYLLEIANLRYQFRSEVGFLQDRILEHLRKHSIHSVVITRALAGSDREAINELISNIKIPLTIVP